MAGRVNASARNSTSGSLTAISASSRSQNRSGLVCGLSTRKIRTPCSIHMPDDPQHLGVDPLGVVVEVERVDVLVLLRRVLRVRDRAVGPGGEPLRVLDDPGVVRRGVQRQVERDLHAQLAGPARRTRRSPPSCPGPGGSRRARPPAAPIAHGEPGSPGCRGQGVVAALPEREPDRVHRRQVDHVEAHRRDRVQPLGRGAQRAGDRRPGPPGRPWPPRTAGRTRTTTRTAPAAGPPARLAPGPGEQVAQRPGGQDGGDVRVLGRGEPLQRRAGPGSRSRRDQRAHRGPARRPGGSRPAAAGSAAAARSNSSAPSVSISSTSWPAGILIAASWCQLAIGSPHASTWKRHSPSLVTVTSAPYRSVPGASSRIGVTRAQVAPSGSRSTAPVPMTPCPSRNTVALT